MVNALLIDVIISTKWKYETNNSYGRLIGALYLFIRILLVQHGEANPFFLIILLIT